MYALLDAAKEVLTRYLPLSRKWQEMISTHICDPGFDRTEKKVVGFMRLGDFGVVINHPSQLYRRKVGGDGKASSVARVTNVNRRFLLPSADTHMSLNASTPSLPFFQTPGETWIPTSFSLFSKWATVFLVRESSHTIALQSGFPVFRLHTTAVSR